MKVLRLLLLLFPASVWADQLLMVRSTQSFPEAMLTLQTALKQHGYTLSRVQRVDIGLTASGFETDKYRIVFFGKPEEIREISSRYPRMIPYLPLKMTIFAEQGETLVVTANPVEFGNFVLDEAARGIFARWRQDILAILAEIRNAD